MYTHKPTLFGKGRLVKLALQEVNRQPIVPDCVHCFNGNFHLFICLTHLHHSFTVGVYSVYTWNLPVQYLTSPWGVYRQHSEAPILWPPDAKSSLIGKDPDAGIDWEQEEKWVTEDEMVGWHHQLNGYEFEQLWEIVKDREAWLLQSMRSQRIRHNLVTEWQQLQTEFRVSMNLTKKKH